MTNRQPATLHCLSCYVLYRFAEKLAARGLRGDVHKDHRIVYQNVLFLCGDALRNATPPCDLGLQTTFRAPTPERPFQPFVRMATIQTVLKQCVENGWLMSPGPRAHPTNFQITPAGKRIALYLLQESSTGQTFLKPEHLQIVDQLLTRWVGVPVWDFAPAFRKVAADAFLAKNVVPHYDLSDESLTPFLEGVAQRARNA